ncbi:DUF3429 domain-containing protein [Aquabacterium sp. A7-Y]|uniref:DUF3429 domain-containing protein n=1 Tax=Aquabacterium sp. A7-Y TaxID=1349605 RepID=UPI00223E4B83|nr:DUF3429 domain-containing protein [Aquabacterium sp. A7-Y]MCW7537059.1 DUF3429 domain-containing protein [Aquabacterium sp. A7-Y]
MTGAASRAPSPAGPNPIALKLGYAGLIPFVLGAALVWLVHPEVLHHVAYPLAGYAALVLSFLGGIHWGLAMRQSVPSPRLYAWGVMPSLVAWVGVVMPPYAGLVVLGAMLVVCYAVDRRVYPRQGAGAWLVLRFRLTAVGSLSCFLAAAGT